MAEFKVGQENVKAEIELRDHAGQETQIHDLSTGITYTSSHPDAVQVVDADANPFDAEVRFLAPVQGAMIAVDLDGDPGADVRPIRLESEEINVSEDVPEGAVSGVIRFVEVAPPDTA